MKRLLDPFLTSFPFWNRRPWLLFLLLVLGPGAYLAGRYFQAQSALTSMHQMEGYREILMRARATAKALGIPADQWRPTIRFEANGEMNRFEQRERDRISAAVRQILPVALVRVLLLEGKGKWVEFMYTGEGHLLGYGASPGIFSSDAMLAHTGTREVAQSALEAIVDLTAFDLGDPTTSTADGGMGQRFVWSLAPKCCRELTTTANVEVVGRRPSFLSVKTSLQPEYMRGLGTPLDLLADVLRIGFLFVATVFAGYRFGKRAMEREVPYTRAAVILFIVALVGVIFAILQPFGQVTGDPIFIAGPFWYAGVTIGVLVFLVLGIMLALAYGAAEGDLREGWPGKLTSLDAFLSGRVLSQNVGASIVAGAAWGACIYGVTQAARALIAPGFIPLHYTVLRYSYSPAPWLALIGGNIVGGIQIAVTVVLLSFAIGQHSGQSMRKRLLITAVCSLGAITLPGSPFADEHAAILAMSHLATMWLGLAGLDFLAAIAALMVTMSGAELADMQAIMPAWRTPATIAFAAGGATLLIALQAAYRGRRYEDPEVIPDYARNIEQRQSRRQEVSAAREAQQRLLPERPPNIAGLGIAAFCAPSSQGVSGDFFDFYPMSRGRLGLLVADGRAGGLGAALTIALAKGFVQYAAHRDWPAGETLRRLREVWQRDRQTEGDLNLVYAVLDPQNRQIRYARLGPTPVILAGLDSQDKAEPLNGPTADGLTEGAGTFDQGDVLLLYTDGVPQRLAASHRDGLDSWLRNKLRLANGVTAYRIGESLQEALRAHQGDAPDDLTAVVIRFEPVEQARLEVSA